VLFVAVTDEREFEVRVFGAGQNGDVGLERGPIFLPHAVTAKLALGRFGQAAGLGGGDRASTGGSAAHGVDTASSYIQGTPLGPGAHFIVTIVSYIAKDVGRGLVVEGVDVGNGGRSVKMFAME